MPPARRTSAQYARAAGEAVMAHHALPALDWHSFLTTWELRPGWLAFCALLLLAYGFALYAAARRGNALVSPVRIACFTTGVVALATCMSSAVDAYAMSLFWMHMIEHLTLITVVPALLVLGHPLTVLRSAGGPEWQRVFDAAMHSLPLSILTHPLVGLTAYGVVVFYTHLTPFMDRMATDPDLMVVEQAAYLASGAWLLLGTIGEEPIRWRTPYLMRLVLLVMAMVPDTLVGIVLLQTTDNPFPTYMAMRPSWAPGALHDLDVGGSLMWAAGDGLMMCMAVGVVVTLLSGGRRDRFLGDWLEGVRTSTFVTHVERTGVELNRPERSLDEDDDALTAYNEMLARLRSGHEDSRPD
jgi:putative membrane protein